MLSTTPSSPTATDADSATTASVLSDYDRYCQTLVDTEDNTGWEAELRHYLKDMPADVTAETDIVKWWQVHMLYSFQLLLKSHCIY